MAPTMPQPKSLEQTAKQALLSKTDIMRLFRIGHRAAGRIYASAEAIDKKDLGEYRAMETRVRTKSVLKVLGLNEDDLKKSVLPNAPSDN